MDCLKEITYGIINQKIKQKGMLTMMKKSIFAGVIAGMILCAVQCYAANIKTGDYVQMGRYYQEPILWRCVEEDENGALMMADQILTLKAFDAKGEHENDYRSYRENFGSNLWETSNLRSWLNSDAEAGNVIWQCGNPPVKSAVWGQYNAYDSEAGFLNDFTDTQKSAIKSVTQKQLLGVRDAVWGGIAESGSENHISYSCKPDVVLKNYDEAYSYNLADKVFVADIKQINEIYNNSEILGEGYYIGTPSKACVENSEYKYSIKEGSNWYSWLRTPYGVTINSETVRHLWSDGTVERIHANTSYIGVRPAFYINEEAVSKTGNGTKELPYIIE